MDIKITSTAGRPSNRRIAKFAPPQLPPFQEIQRSALIHEAGHIVIGWLEGIKDQAVEVFRQPKDGCIAGAYWYPDRVSDEQFIRRTVAGVLSQAKYCPESFPSKEALLALNESLIPAGRTERFATLGVDALNDLSVARDDLAQLVGRLSHIAAGDERVIAELVKPHENHVRKILDRSEVALCIQEVANLIQTEVDNAKQGNGRSATVFAANFEKELRVRFGL